MMSDDDRLKAKAGPLVFWLAVVIFFASLCAGVFRSLQRSHAPPRVGVEYISELRTAFQDKGYQQTLPWMTAAIEIDLDNDTTARELLQVARQAEDRATAFHTLEKLVRLLPEDGELRTEFVSGLLSQGRVVEALAHGQVAVRLKPNSAVAHGNLGTAYLALDLKDEAAAAYRQALRLDPTYENARQALEFPLRGH
jgi:tetratricopeptide (TPR) repeat protein